MAAAARARAIVMDIERSLGFDPTDREFERLGYDIESRAGAGRLRFIEVKGRVTGADTITVTKNEILTSLNKPEDFVLALVEFLDARAPQRPLPASSVRAKRHHDRLQRRQRGLSVWRPPARAGDPT